MDFETLVRRFRILFSYFGIVPFSSTTKRAQKWKMHVEIVPVILYLVFIVTLVSTATVYHLSTPSVILVLLISYARILSEISVQFTIIGQVFVFRKRLKKLYDTYYLIQDYMKTRMGYNVDCKVIRRRLYQLIVAVLVPQLTALVFRRTVIRSANPFSEFIHILSLFHLLASLVQLHVIAHVELLRFFLTQMTLWLREQVSEYSTKSLRDLWKMQEMNSYNKILQLKFLHFKLWELTLNFNRIFGWSMGAIILQNSSEIAYRAYWICVHFVGGMSLFKIISRELTSASISFQYLFLFFIFFEDVFDQN